MEYHVLSEFLLEQVLIVQQLSFKTIRSYCDEYVGVNYCMILDDTTLKERSFRDFL